MRKNDMFEIEITGMTHEGMGVGRKDGMAVFVQGAVDGETVMAKVIKTAKNFAVARIEKLIKRSPERQEPFCQVYKRCGGCSLQHVSYKKQLEFKRRVVFDNLVRIGGFKDVEVNPVIGMDDPTHYRNKAQYPVGMGSSGPVAGFYARHSHEIINSESCQIQDAASQNIRNVIIEKISEDGIPAYDEKTGKGVLRHIISRVSQSTGDIMVVLVVTKETVPGLDMLVRHIVNEVPEVKSIVLNINNRKDNVILSEKVITVYGQDTIVDRLGPFFFHISPLSFYQVNPRQTLVLYEKAVEFAGFTENKTVFDLYCGIGTISLFLAQRAKKVVGVEIVEEAIEAAKQNARLNNIGNTDFYAGRAEDIVTELYRNGIKADVVVVDPPRKGCDQTLLETIIQMQPARIVYVSCNPSTLARDLKCLCACEYKICEVQPVDMFPWTEHVECVALMSRNM